MIDLTPLEVRKKKGDFRRAMRGYESDSVDDFLELVADRLDELVRENLSLAERVARQDQQVADYREREKALTEALVTAQEMRDEMRRQTMREVELAKQAAEQEVSQMRSSTTNELAQHRAKAQQEASELKARVQQEVSELRTTIRSEREREEEALRTLRARQQQFVSSYRSLLEQELDELEVMMQAMGVSAGRSRGSGGHRNSEPADRGGPGLSRGSEQDGYHGGEQAGSRGGEQFDSREPLDTPRSDLAGREARGEPGQAGGGTADPRAIGLAAGAGAAASGRGSLASLELTAAPGAAESEPDAADSVSQPAAHQERLEADPLPVEPSDVGGLDVGGLDVAGLDVAGLDVEPFEPEPFQPDVLDEDEWGEYSPAAPGPATGSAGDAAGIGGLDPVGVPAEPDDEWNDDPGAFPLEYPPADDEDLRMYDVVAADSPDAGVPGPIGLGIPGEASPGGFTTTFGHVDEPAGAPHEADAAHGADAGDADDDADSFTSQLLRNAQAAGYHIDDDAADELLLLDDAVADDDEDGQDDGWLPTLLEDDK